MSKPLSIAGDRRPFVERFKWKRVQAPRPWYPKEGDEIAGYYGGKTTRVGKYGSYELAIVHVPNVGTYTITGIMVIQALDSSAVSPGHPVRITFNGMQQARSDSEKTFKTFKVEVAEGPGIHPDELPILDDEDDLDTTATKLRRRARRAKRG